MNHPTDDLNWVAQLPFASVIQTNYAPTAEELVRSKVLLSEPQLQLSQLESEVAHVQSVLDDPSHGREIVIESHRALTSPIRRLPTEMLSEIFLRCLPVHYPVGDVSQAPLLLTFISREWRQTAIGTPSLWRSLHIYVSSRLSSQILKSMVIGCTLWLERSGSLPISISLYLDTSRDHSPRQTKERMYIRSMPADPLAGGHAFMEILIQFSTRVGDLTFTGTKFSHIATYLDSLVSHNFPILNRFRVRSAIHNAFLDWAENELPFASVVQCMPALKKLCVRDFSQSCSEYNRLQLNWENITVLLLEPTMLRSFRSHFPSGEILSMLRRTPRLKSLTLQVDICNWEPTYDTAVNLPTMCKLKLTFVNRGPDNVEVDDVKTFFSNFFRSILCPSLKVLSVSWRGTRICIPHVPFSTFTVSLQEVETLSLNIALTPDSLLGCLSLIPNLRSLEIKSNHSPSSHPVEDSVFTFLLGNLRLLQHIRLIYKDKNPSLTYGALLTFIESRVQTLQSCDVFFPKPPAEPVDEDLRRIQVLVDAGLEIRIRYAKAAPPSNSDIDEGLSGYTASHSSILDWHKRAKGEAVPSDMEGRYGTGIIV